MPRHTGKLNRIINWINKYYLKRWPVWVCQNLKTFILVSKIENHWPKKQSYSFSVLYLHYIRTLWKNTYCFPFLFIQYIDFWYILFLTIFLVCPLLSILLYFIFIIYLNICNLSFIVVYGLLSFLQKLNCWFNLKKVRWL